MYEVIIERPRGGAGWETDWPRWNWRSLGHTDDEDRRDGGPTKLRMGPRRRSKWLSENLAPLRRFLMRRLGQPWDRVYSEICARIAPRSAVQKHVLDHLRHYVELHPVIIDGYPHHPTYHSGSPMGTYRPLSDYGHNFYVCPETGRLLQPPRRARKVAPRIQRG